MCFRRSNDQLPASSDRSSPSTARRPCQKLIVLASEIVTTASGENPSQSTRYRRAAESAVNSHAAKRPLTVAYRIPSPVAASTSVTVPLCSASETIVTPNFVLFV